MEGEVSNKFVMECGPDSPAQRDHSESCKKGGFNSHIKSQKIRYRECVCLQGKAEG